MLGALGRLSERQRVAVALRYVEDVPYAEIAETTAGREHRKTRCAGVSHG